MTIEQKNKAFKIFVQSLEEVTNELNKHLNDCRKYGRIPCVYTLKSKTEKIEFWSNAMIRLSNK